MNQAEKIYEFLSKTRNQAADEALAMSLDCAREPYASVILETILGRADTTSIANLISKYHELPGRQKKLILAQPKSTFMALRRAASASEPQTRLNCLEIIANNNMERLSDAVIKLMRDSDIVVSDRASEILMSMATAAIAHRDDPTCQDSQYLITALQNGINSFDIHNLKQVIKAAMYVVPADRYSFWHERLQDFNPVGRAVRYYLMNDPDLEMANFCLTALKVDALKGAVSRAIAWQENPNFIIALARTYHHKRGNTAIEIGLKNIKRAQWLEENKIALDKLSVADQRDFLNFINALDLSIDVKRKYLLLYRDNVTAEITNIIYNILLHDNADDVESLEYFLTSADPVLACKALRKIIEQKPANLNEIVSRQLRSANSELQQIANRYFIRIAFDSWWGNFEKLKPEKLAAAGKAIAKIDPHLQDRIRAKLRDKNPSIKVKALMAIRYLQSCVIHRADIQFLTNDKNVKVRSCAIATLGHLGKNIDSASIKYLLHALKDQDKRVCANAIEALDKCGFVQASRIIELFKKDTNSRVRANANNAKFGLTKSVTDVGGILADSQNQIRKESIQRKTEIIKQSVSQTLSEQETVNGVTS
ncbi:MAG: HEAT repeat domain-containing protein [Phycisphaerae bacterium]|nr:HEAT repeat domain-containing protein [Phycisphaerae bacterium]